MKSLKIIDRPNGLKWLWQWKDQEPIKVVTGIRRCGKSTLLSIFQSQLRENGINEGQIISINFEHPDFMDVNDSAAAWKYIKPKIARGRKSYVFLDEVQRLKDFEKIVDGLFVLPDVDVYITGSNAHLLSSELATYLSGRYVTLHLMPLSFREFYEGVGFGESPERAYRDYLAFTSFPHDNEWNKTPRLVDNYLEGIFNTVLMKDVINRNAFRNPIALEAVTKYIFDNIGNLTSMRNIASALKAEGVTIDASSVEGYVSALCGAYLAYKAIPKDLRGRELLKSGAKYYVVDIGLRRFELGNRSFDAGRILENIVYLELVRRHQEVYIGRIDGREVDFVTRDGGEIKYWQVTETLRGESVRQREFAPFKAISDHYPKTILSLDLDPVGYQDGIKTMNALDFLLDR
jgi:predicted AAA+ superfamily ATPase